MKVVINTCFGGYGLSYAALARYAELAGVDPAGDIRRDDPLLVQVVEELGARAYGAHARLSIVDIPDGVAYAIEAFDGAEQIVR